MPFLRTAFLDLLLNALLLFVCLFALAFMQMRPVQDGRSIEAKAELMLEMTWPDGSLDDVDLWVLLPDGQKVGFNRKDPGVATLDRDDRGAYGDTFGTAPRPADPREPRGRRDPRTPARPLRGQRALLRPLHRGVLRLQGRVGAQPHSREGQAHQA